jgi:hypothetical protein
MEVGWNVGSQLVYDTYENNIQVSRFKMAFIMNVANILRASLETRNCMNFLNYRNISCLHRNLNKYLLREARVMQKMLGNKRTGKCVPYFYFVTDSSFVFILCIHIFDMRYVIWYVAQKLMDYFYILWWLVFTCMDYLKIINNQSINQWILIFNYSNAA